ncbi:MAG: S41 family peptidase [Pseudomonadota bacterium]
MNHTSTTLRAFTAGCLLLGAGISFAASSPASIDDEALAALQGAYARAVVPGEQSLRYQELFATVLQRVKRSHALPVDLAGLAATAMKVVEPLPPGAGEPAEVFRKAIQEVLRTLDPHTRYLDARTHANERSESGGSFGGLGLEVESSAGAVRVVAPMPDSPAARAGLVPGDLIVRVDELPLLGVPLAEAIARMRGEPGTPVTITIQRTPAQAGAAPAGTAQEFTVALTRDTIRRQVLRWSMEGNVLVLRLGAFSGPVSASLAQAIAEASGEAGGVRPQAVVLDMRGNPGGLLHEAVRVADTFLGKGDIVSLRGGSTSRQRAWQADAAELLEGVPMVVMIDGRSASASELVADALQHHGRAVVMGQRSFGKGSVQTTFPLGDERGALKLTTALYHGPSGNTVHRVGVAPDIELSGPAAGNSFVPAGTAPARTAQARVDPGRCVAAARERDPGLSCALAYLRVGSVDAFVASLADIAP